MSKLTIFPGKDKSGKKESFDSISLESSKIYAIVGPTGSGKTQLLDDIERLCPGDGTTKRIIKSDIVPNIHHLSQKMHYMVDMEVEEFVILYGESLGQENPIEYCKEIIACANSFCGEPLYNNFKLTRLSGGQSRALMIATVALNINSDVVLLDEIENAGINRLKVLQTLISKNKIVLLITHDPLLALLADHRIVMSNGGITQVIHRTHYEKNLTSRLMDIDDYLNNIRDSIRQGKTIKGEIFDGEVILEQYMSIK